MCPQHNQSAPPLAPSQNGMSQKQKSVTQHTAGYSNVKVPPPELLASNVTCVIILLKETTGSPMVTIMTPIRQLYQHTEGSVNQYSIM
jgi:hypothetical protein